MNEYKSVVDGNKNYSKEAWVVSLIHHGDLFGGHAEIVVEGINEDNSIYFKAFHIIPAFYNGEDPSKSYLPMIFNNAKGEANIFIVENAQALSEYISECQRKRSWYRYPEQAQKMINNIVIEKQKCDEDKVLFQYAGTESFWSSSTERRFNCIDWCKSKLLVADINIENKPLDYIFKSMPAKHASPMNDHVNGVYNEIASKATGVVLVAEDILSTGISYARNYIGL